MKISQIFGNYTTHKKHTSQRSIKRNFKTFAIQMKIQLIKCCGKQWTQYLENDQSIKCMYEWFLLNKQYVI